RRLRALTEEKLLHLVLEELARLRLDGRQPILVDEHRLMLEPALPRELRHVLVDALPERTGVRRPVEAFGLFAEQHAMHHPSQLPSPRAPPTTAQPAQLA